MIGVTNKRTAVFSSSPFVGVLIFYCGQCCKFMPAIFSTILTTWWL